MKVLFTAFAALGCLMLVLGSSEGVGKDKDPKYTIKEVMKKAMAGGLCKKCASGKASDEEKKLLAEMFVALHENSPPKGEKDNWAKVTKALADAAKAVAEGKDDDAGKKLGALVNCKNCHSEFKKS
jgi:hypothetical protein